LKQQQADGFVTASAVGSADIRIQDFKLQMRRSENSYETLWKVFRQLTGIDELNASTVLPKEIPAIGVRLGDVVKNLDDRPGSYLPANLANADDGVRSEQLNYEITKTRLKPQLGMSASASQQNQNPNNNTLGPKQLVTNYGAYATVNWTLFDGFATQALKQSSLIRLRQLKNSREQAERDYRESLKSCIVALQLNWETLQKTEEGLRDTRASVDTYQKDFEAGFAPKKAWDDGKLAADNALQAANNARADYYLQIVNYLSLRGKDPVVNPAAKK
jgi:outer membrane protein TolC